MAAFSLSVAAMLAGQVVRSSVLFEFEFASETMRIWGGFGPLVSGGQTWQGIGQSGAITDLDPAGFLTGDPTTITLSGIDAGLAALALDQSAEVSGRFCRLYLQFFNEDWSPLDPPSLRITRLMDTMKVTLTPDSGKIELRLEDELSTKHRPPYGNYTHHDQIARHPGDLGFERVAALADKEINWP